MAGVLFSFEVAKAKRGAEAQVKLSSYRDLESEATRLALRAPFLKARMEYVFGRLKIETAEPKLGVMNYTVKLPDCISVEKNAYVVSPFGSDDNLNRAIAKLYIQMTQFMNGVILKQIDKNHVQRFGYDEKDDQFFDIDARAACGVVTTLRQCAKATAATPA